MRYFVIAVTAFFALKIGDNISAFFLSFTTILNCILGYGLTGMVFGFVLWLMFERDSKKLVYYLPLFLILAQWIASYIAFGDSGRSEDFSPFRVLGYMLTSELGFFRLVVIPFGAFGAVWLLAKYRPSPTLVNGEKS